MYDTQLPSPLTDYNNGTKSQNVNVSSLVLQLPLPNPLTPGVKWRIALQLEHCQLRLSDQQFIAY